MRQRREPGNTPKAGVAHPQSFLVTTTPTFQVKLLPAADRRGAVCRFFYIREFPCVLFDPHCGFVTLEPGFFVGLRFLYGSCFSCGSRFLRGLRLSDDRKAAGTECPGILWNIRHCPMQRRIFLFFTGSCLAHLETDGRKTAGILGSRLFRYSVV